MENDDDSKMIMLDLEIHNLDYTLCALYIHGTNKDTQDFYSNIKQNIITQSNAPVIICGHWNVT